MTENKKAHAANGSIMLDWQEIDCVFLDMDGTLLDLNYDNHVWNELVPQAYAECIGVNLEDAQHTLLTHMREIRGSIEFYSFDYWISYTGIDLVGVHQQATHLLAYRPNALQFLRWLQQTGRKSVIATNAHPDSIAVKHAHTGICDEVDHVVSSYEFDAPKEAQAYWHSIFRQHPHEPQRCLFIDDNEPVLDAARDANLGYLLAVSSPDSQRPPRAELRYPSFDDFSEVCATLTQAHV
jgi:putative hydrolase of the HAD superfamily